MKLVQNYRADGRTPTDDEINQCIEIANREDCIVHLEWVFSYSGRYSVDIIKGMTYEVIKNKYSKEIEKLLEDIRLEHERDEAEETIRIQEYMSCPSSTSTDFELPDDKELPF